MAENTFGSQSVTQTTTTTLESTISVTLHMPVENLKFVLQYLNPEQAAQLIKNQADEARKILQDGKKDISENQVHALNQQMTNSLENLIATFKEQICRPLQVDPINDSIETKLFKVRANKHIIAVLEDISSWLKVTLQKVSAPDKSIEEKVKEYEEIIRNLKIKIMQLKTDKISVKIESSDEDLPSHPKCADLKNDEVTKANEKQKLEKPHYKDEQTVSNGDQNGKIGNNTNQNDRTANGKNTDEHFDKLKNLKLS